ncbi:MAG: ABC transporter permease, partial [Cohaesibacter sp.]|nr:ABC transporter permease [Cohaesibacter sp.]
MLSFILRRLGQSSVLVLIMSVLVFAGMYVVSDPVAVLAGDDFTEEDRQALARELGVDKPLITQYLVFLSNIAKGDFGVSFVYNRPVLDLILERLPATLEVAVLAISMGLILGIPMGIYSGLNREKKATKSISFLTTVGY